MKYLMHQIYSLKLSVCINDHIIFYINLIINSQFKIKVLKLKDRFYHLIKSITEFI